MKKGLIVAALLFASGILSAKEILVTMDEAAAKAKDLQAGEVLIIQDGVYNDVQLKLDLQGTQSAPIMVKAQTLGGVILTGKSVIAISGEYITVSGFYFKDCDRPSDGLISFRTSPKKVANNSVVEECAISGSGLEPDNTDGKWVNIYGTGNTIRRCSFLDKKNLGTLLVVWVDTTQVSNHRILNNYFTRPYSLKDDRGSATNGQETIRIGTSQVSMGNAGCLVQGNLFYQCNGEVEVISNKSCYNRYNNNLFLECQGALTLRHGNNCLVENNFFIGNKVPSSGGVRIIGDHHTIRNNYFQDLAGRDERAAISIRRAVPNPKLHEYWQVYATKVTNNTIVNCYQGINGNIGKDKDQISVVDTEVSGNLIVSDVKNAVGLNYFSEFDPKIAWKDNLVSGAKLMGEVKAKEMDPKMKKEGDLYYPQEAKVKGYGVDYKVLTAQLMPNKSITGISWELK